MVKTELAYYKHTHRCDVIARPSLFKLNNLSHEDRLTNLCILLADDNYLSTHSITDLPTSITALDVIREELHITSVAEEHQGDVNNSPDIEQHHKLNSICVTIWTVNDEPQWYLGYITDINHDKESCSYTVEHLTRVNKDTNYMWKYPTVNDIAENLREDQILDVNVEGDWDTSSVRNTKYVLRNHVLINEKFKEVQKK